MIAEKRCTKKENIRNTNCKVKRLPSETGYAVLGEEGDATRCARNSAEPEG
jgi:hypothetical protein